MGILLRLSGTRFGLGCITILLLLILASLVTQARAASTVLFSSGFEEATFSAGGWSTDVSGVGSAAQLITNPVYTGTQSAQFTTNTMTNGQHAFATHDISWPVSNIATLKAAIQPQVTSIQLPVKVLGFETRGPGNWVTRAALGLNANHFVAMYTTKDGQTHFDDTGSAYAPNQWYQAAITVDMSTANSTYTYSVNGTVIYTVTDTTTGTQTSLPAYILTGFGPGNWGANSGTVVVDSVEVDAGGSLPTPAPTPVPSPSPTPTPTGVTTTSWTQDGGNAQHTGSTSEEASTPWKYLWSFNGSDSSGGATNHIFDAPQEARVISGGGNIYVPAGKQGLYALRESDGTTLWHATPINVSFNAAAAYDPSNGYVLVGGTDGNLYAFNAQNGNIINTFYAGSPIEKAVIVVGTSAYIVTNDGHLFKVNLSNLAVDSSWPIGGYAAGSNVATMPAYSASRNSLIFATMDNYVHAVNATNGTRNWRVLPSTNIPTLAGIDVQGHQVWINSFYMTWPVIAEQHGIVFLRMSLDPGTLGATPGTLGYFPPGTAAQAGSNTRSWLQANPQYQNLFALSLDNGAQAFIPAVGYGSNETVINGVPYGTMMGMPAVKVWPNGDEVAYTIFRTNTCGSPDYRWDGHTGEMVLDSTTVNGLQPGDVRFVAADTLCYGTHNYSNIIDEEEPFTLAGSTLFRSHWGAVESGVIGNRATTLGLAYNTPIEFTEGPAIIRAQSNDTNLNVLTHYTTSGLT